MKHVLKYLGIGMALSVMAAPALAGAHTYNTKVQTIRCGVLLANRDAWSDATVGGGNAHRFSYVFHALNARPDVRPYAWDIVNPFAPPFMDGTMAQRYGVTLVPGNPPRLNKNMGAYWEVYLHEVTPEQLANYDVLYMPVPIFGGGDEALTVADREKLRRAVDAGVTLWMDNGLGGATSIGSGATDFINPVFLRSGGGFQYGDPMNSLMNSPNQLAGRDISRLGMGGAGSLTTIDFPMPSGSLVPTAYPAVDLPWTVAAAVGNNPTIEVAPYGQGAVVVTSRAIGRELTQGFRTVRGVDTAPVNGVAGFANTTQNNNRLWRNGNAGVFSYSDASRVAVPELKFLINLISYRFQSPQQGGGPRHASGSRQDLNTPLGRKWQYPENFRFQPGNFKYVGVKFVSEPVVWNGILYAATSDGFLRAYDMDPGRDLDGNGNPDDGLPNPLTPSSDIIWEAALPEPCSSLTIGDVGNRPRLYGMLASGKIFSAEALPRKNGRLLGTSIQTQQVRYFGAFPQLFKNRLNPNFVPGEEDAYRIPAPVWYNGRLFVAGMRSAPDAAKGFGAIAEIDPRTLTTKWEYPDGCIDPAAQAVPTGRLGIPSATPTVAAIPDKGYSGATDIMLLVPTLSISVKSNMGPATPSRVVAFPLGVRGEKLLFNGATDTGLKEYFTRFSQANSVRAVNVTVWVPDNTGAPRTGTMKVDTASGRNRLYVDVSLPMNYDNEARADYDFVPGPPSTPFAGYTPRWGFDAWSYAVGGIEKFMEILTSPVVSAAGGMYWVASDVGQGANQAPIVMGAEMRQQNLGFNVTANPNYTPPLNTPQLTFMYSVGSRGYVAGGCDDTSPTMAQPVVLGTPAIDRGILYVPYGQWLNGASTGGVSGFYVQGTKFGLLLAYPVDPAQKGSVSIVQRNQCTGDLQQVGYGLFDVDNVSIGNTLRGLLTFRSLNTGPGAGSLDLSRSGDISISYQALDVTTGRATAVQNESPTPYYKTDRGEGPSPDILVAFSGKVPISTGGGVRTGVTVAGGSIYIGSDSGDIWTVPLPTNLDVVQGKIKSQMKPATFPSLAVSAGYAAGTPYPTDPGAALRCSPVVANGTLIQNAPVGLYTFYSPRTLITESTRIIEVAAAYKPDDTLGSGVYDALTGMYKNTYSAYLSAGSEVVWTLDSTTQNREFGAPGAGPLHPPWAEGRLNPPVERALSQPSMAIRVNSTNTLICDTGNNRVVEVDRTGNIVWQCTEFADPNGMLGANESRSLSSPTSVQRWETFEWDEQDQTPARAQHNLIADYGNNRILEIVTRFSQDPNDQANNVLIWVGRGPAGKAYQFYQAQREAYYNPGNANHGSLDLGRTIASVVNLAVNGAEVQSDDPALKDAKTGLADTAGGSLVILGGQKDTYDKGAKSASGKVIYFLNRGRYEGETTTAFAFNRPVYFDRYVTGDGAFAWKVTMTDGANVMTLTKEANAPPGVATIITKFPDGPIVSNLALGNITKGLMGSGGYTMGTTMAKRLQNGNMLMVNQKTGYVFEFSPTAAKAMSGGSGGVQDILSFTAPSIVGTAALNRPVFADRLF